MTNDSAEELSESGADRPAPVGGEDGEHRGLHEVKLDETQGVEVPVLHDVSPTEHPVEGERCRAHETQHKHHQWCRHVLVELSQVHTHCPLQYT